MNDHDLFSILKLWVYAPFAGVIISLISFANWLYKNAKAEIKELQDDNEENKIKIARQDERLKNLEKK